MSILDFADHEALGRVRSVDTATVIVRVDDIEALRAIQVNRLVALQSSLAGHKLIGVIYKITRTALEEAKVADVDLGEEAHPEVNLVRVTLIGTLLDRDGSRSNVFRRTLETVPEIDAYCFALESERLTRFMSVISDVTAGAQRLSLGAYTLDPKAEAYVNGNKLFSAMRWSSAAPAPASPGRPPASSSKWPSSRAPMRSYLTCMANMHPWLAMASSIFASQARAILTRADGYPMAFFIFRTG
ncbi:hypothetical protein ACVWZL_000530 [Bradyrhizobium sp. GM2.4]